jgi:membrane-associated protease RseP (regulator of RpoE activity)
MKYVKLLLVMQILLPLIGGSAFAIDFYGASVTDKDVPSSFMRCGIYGDHLVVDSVASDSPAENAGFMKGDVIMSINDKVVGRLDGLVKIIDDILNVSIFNGSEWKMLTINRLAIATEKASQLEAERKAAVVAAANRAHSSSPGEDTSPPLKLDDSMLSNSTSNVIDDRPDSLDKTQSQPTDTPNQDWPDNSDQDLQGIDW